MLESGKKDSAIKLSNQMEEIKRLSEKVYEFEIVNQQQTKEISVLKDSLTLHEQEKHELIEQLKERNTELTLSEKNKQNVSLLTKALDKMNSEKLELK